MVVPTPHFYYHLQKFNKMHTEIQKLYNNGQISEGIDLALRHIAEEGPENSQLEILLLAKGLYATRFYYHAHYWLQRTIADPETKIALEEKLSRKLPHFHFDPVLDKVG